MTPPLLKVFVYGTLKRGYWNHEPYLGTYVASEPCTIRGRLLRRHTGTPILDLPRSHILAVGTRDVARDLETQAAIAREWNGFPGGSAPGDGMEWLDVQGELYTLRDTAIWLPKLDGLEEFTPETPAASLYDRVLAPVGREGSKVAWVYVIPLRKCAADYAPAHDPACWLAENEMPADVIAQRREATGRNTPQD